MFGFAVCLGLFGFSFIGAILSIKNSGGNPSESKSRYPIMIDSPFTGLASRGTDYKKTAAGYLLDISEQLILFVSDENVHILAHKKATYDFEIYLFSTVVHCVVIK